VNTAGSLLLLFIFAILIFGVPILLLALRLVETISEWREPPRRAEDESTAGEKTVFENKAPVEKRSTNDASEWTPAKHMR
jgi:hypothetical protein